MRARIWLVALLVGCGGSSETAATGGDGEPADASSSDATDETRADDSSAEDSSAEDGGDASASADTGAACGCASYAAASSAGTIGNPALNEISGLASSSSSPGVIWAHNDSGDSPRFFAINEKGAFLGELSVTGATAVDWEDMAVGPCPAGSCIYIGDFGDNGMARDNDALYRIVEPKLAAEPFAKRSVEAEKIPFAYPDGKWNAEALLVHPKTGEIVIVTKGGSPGIYRFPPKLTAGTKVTLTKVSVPAGLDGVVTGGDVSPCGDRALLRTYTALFEYRISDLAAGLATPPKKVPVGKEGQGEAVTYRADGRGYFTASEGTSVALFATACE